MAPPFFRIQHRIQEEHILLREDVSRLLELSESLDPRIMHYCKILRNHKNACPICSWPRLYPFIRKTNRLLKAIFLRKVLERRPGLIIIMVIFMQLQTIELPLLIPYILLLGRR